MTARRQPLMEISENDAPATNSTAANSRRKSGRAVRAPEKFVPDIPSSQQGNTSAKRKRVTEDVENDASDLEEDEEEESDGSDEEESAGEEEVRESRKKATRKAKKPAAKKPKVNGASLHEEEESEAHAVRLPSRPKKGKKGTKVAIADKSAEGLYAEVYMSGRPMDEVVADWVAHYNDNNSEALTDLINLIIRSTGCEIEVTEDDINDPENIEGRLSDIQQEFQATNPSDYPLISKAKSSQTFKACLGNFFDLLIRTIHESGLMYDEVALLENLHSWVVTMSSSTTRAFRHTSAFIALTITSAMCSISKDLAEKSAKILRQYEGEKKKKQANKSRLAEFKKKVEDCESSTSLLEDTIKDFFDTVFVHRYRDVDPRIRADCVEALGTWIAEMPRVFFDGSYLRYLGWMLSDVHHPTRHEVVKQLARIMKNKDNAAGMRHFIERFKTRLVEIAIQDSEPSVRSTGVELINLIRDAGMLEPDDIDSVGKLIFDTEPKVRKAVVPFFTENIQDLYEVKVEEIGGEEALEEILGGDPEDFDSPREEWIKLKSLAEILSTYDTEDSEDMPSQVNQAITGNLSSATESRFTCAAQALYDKMPELKDWEVLAGYLLFDHSAKAKGSEAERALKESFKPDESEEIILLDILTATVKINLTESSHLEKGKKSTKLELQEAREAAARHLADIIPRLLKKFGASPKTVTIVLRLEHALNLEVFQELRQDSTGYAKLLDEISAQFTRHADKNVLNEASASLLHARGYEDLEEVTESKMQSLWEDTTDTLRKINKAGEISVRGGFSIPALTELSSNLARLDKLSSISSCVEPLETDPGNDEPLAINILLDVVARGELSEPDPDIDSLEDEVVQSAIQSSIFYFMWKTRSLLESIASEEPILQDDVEHLKERKELFTNNLIRSLSSRASLDPVRLLATGTLLDLHALFVNMNTAKNSKAKDGDDAMEVDENDQYEHLQELVTEIGPEVQAEITSIFDACERQYAKKANKTRFLAEPGEDEEPQDIEDEPEDEEEEDVTDNERQGEILKAEQQLCELTGKIILAICAQVIDASGELKGKLRSRIQRNRTKLGPNFKDIVAYLDDPKQKGKKSHKSKAQQAAVAARKSAKSKEIVEEEEEEDDPIEEEEPEEGTAEDLRRRELVDDNEAPVSVDDEEDHENGDAGADEDDQEEVLGD